MGFVMRKYACVEVQSHFRLPEMEAAVDSVFQKLDGLVYTEVMLAEQSKTICEHRVGLLSLHIK